jgi:hypothetical protein
MNINPSVWNFNNVIAKINAGNGNLIDYAVIGSQSNFRIEGVYTVDNKTIVTGSTNGDLHPDMNDPTVTIPNRGGTDIVTLVYDGLISKYGPNEKMFFSKLQFGDEHNAGVNFSKLKFSGGESFQVFGGNQSCDRSRSAPLKSTEKLKENILPAGVLYIADDKLQLLDSLLLKGSGLSEIYQGKRI